MIALAFSNHSWKLPMTRANLAKKSEIYLHVRGICFASGAEVQYSKHTFHLWWLPPSGNSGDEPTD